MRLVVWIAESTWEACVDEARAVAPAGAEITLLHVAPSDVEELVGTGPAGLLGRRPPRPPGPPPREIAEEEARALLGDALERLALPAQTMARCGRVEHEVLDACAKADMLVLGRDGERRAGPRSLAPRTRFVVDHAPCTVVLVWPAGQPPAGTAS